MPRLFSTDDFLVDSAPILDSRSPGEYEQGHIPGAISFPLFDDSERSQIGTCYKQIGKAEAIELGLAIVAPKMVDFVQKAKQLAPDRQIRLHCWRGGMRSSSMAWLLETAGFEVTLLEGGYKAFRRWVRSTLSTPRLIVTLGGMTGTGKTKLLAVLADRGEQVLDLEALAQHRGSSYGAIGLPTQPTNEQFENLLAMQWRSLKHDRLVWIEAESRRVGLCRVPDEIFMPMLRASIVQIMRSRSERIKILLEVYGAMPAEALIEATERISRKIGGQNAQRAIQFIREGDLAPAIDLVLDYYDKTYLYDLQRRDVPVYSVEASGCEDSTIASLLIEKSKQIIPQLAFK